MSAQTLVSAVTLYLELGWIIAFAFVLIVGRIDSAARGAFSFRLLLIPGAVLLWPVVLVRTARALVDLQRSAS
jgi:hypothetical protein